MKAAATGCAGVLLILIAACSSMPATEHSSANDADVHYPRLSTLTASELGTLYLFDGIIYWDFEDAGMMPTELRDREALKIFEDLKFEAFCFRSAPEAMAKTDQLRSSPGKKVTVARMRAVVRFVGQGERRGALVTNQCRSGDVMIESILSFRPLRYASSADKVK